MTSSLPLEWLTHLISPIHKAGDKSVISNYRPISLLCSVSKVLEKLVYNKTIDFVSPHLSHLQFGFLANRSVLHQLLIFLSSIMEAFSTKSSTDVIYLDIRKAFDSISHSILLTKLSSVGFSGRLLEWFKCYLTLRQQCVVVRGTKSSMLPVLSGVPQGSILGPLLFILYIDDLPSALGKALPLMFADDTKCFAPVVSPVDCLSLQNNLNSLVIWSEQAKLLFNHTKCSSMRFSNSSSLLPPPSYTINGIDIPNRNLVKDLGIWLSSDLDWSHHYQQICAKAYKMLSLIRRNISPQCSPDLKRALYLCLIRSQLSFCSQLWRPRFIKDIISLERIQRRSTKFILNDFATDYKSRLISLHLTPLMYFFKLNDILFFIRCVKNPPPNFDIMRFVSFSNSSIHTRSTSCGKLQHHFSPNNYTRFFYFNRLPTLWNILPPIDLSLSFPTLKSFISDFMWNKFLDDFNATLPCTYHLKCPCQNCHSKPHSCNLL